ncbi:hypothetical protein PIB30_074338 [Stylosanthes scabra]|uniref:Uncharacterized protein n=1 Tax=Stylosanthes scabra TaxID=79078 RepID=A0ABU6ZN95_9FABA|nr:hypothetical protein [Stylosanthes scabra]
MRPDGAPIGAFHGHSNNRFLPPLPYKKYGLVSSSCVGSSCTQPECLRSARNHDSHFLFPRPLPAPASLRLMLSSLYPTAYLGGTILSLELISTQGSPLRNFLSSLLKVSYVMVEFTTPMLPTRIFEEDKAFYNNKKWNERV